MFGSEEQLLISLEKDSAKSKDEGIIEIYKKVCYNNKGEVIVPSLKLYNINNEVKDEN